jgi:hypothetical protein
MAMNYLNSNLLRNILLLIHNYAIATEDIHKKSTFPISPTGSGLPTDCLQQRDLVCLMTACSKGDYFGVPVRQTIGAPT